MPEFWSGFCTFKTEGTWTDYMMCSPQKQAAIVEYYQSRRHIPGFAELLTFTPCDLWPVIRSASDAPIICHLSWTMPFSMLHGHQSQG